MRQNQIIAIFGRKGLGKTYLLKYIVKNCRRLLLIDPLNEFENGKVVYDRASLFEELERTEFRVIFRPLNTDDFDYAVQLAVVTSNMTLAIDEVDQYTSSYYMSEPLRWAIHYGRHYNLYIVIASRMPQRIRSDITAQADVILTFQQQGRSTVSYLKDFTDWDAEALFKRLEKYKFISIVGDFSLDNPPDLP